MSNRIGIGIDVFGAGIDADATTIYNRIIADGGVSNLSRLNFFVKGLKAIYGDLANVPVCYDAHWIGYKLGSGTGATAGQAAAKLYSLTVAGDAVQTTAASQPLLLSHNGASSDNYYFNDDTGTSSISKSISNIATGTNYVFEFGVNSPFASGNIRTIASHGQSGGTGGSIWIRWSSNVLVFDYRNPRNEVSSNTLNANSRFFKIEYIKNSAVSYTITFSEKANIGDSYTINKTATVTGATTTMDAINTAWMGSLGSIFGLLGKLLFVNCTVDGNAIYNFQASNYVASNSQTTLPDEISGNWTINTGTATSGYKGVLVNRTIVQSDGVDDKLTASGFSAITLNTRFAALNPINISGGYIIQGRQSGTGDKHLWYQTGGNIQAYTNAGGSINFAGIAANSLKLYSTDFNTTSSNCLTNNVNQVNGTLNSDSFTDLDIFGGGTFKNCVINTLIETSSVSSATQRTAMYNYIRSLNNNAF